MVRTGIFLSLLLQGVRDGFCDFGDIFRGRECVIAGYIDWGLLF